MESIKLLKATPKDATAIFKLTQQSFEAYAEKIFKDGQIEALTDTEADVMTDIKTKHVYICEIDGVLAGSVRFEILDENIAYLTRFGVDPTIQSLGIGSLLIEKVTQECANLGVKAITLFTASKMTSSVSFYLKHGYYVHNITRDRGYIRAFLVKELVPMDELFDYERIVKQI